MKIGDTKIKILDVPEEINGLNQELMKNTINFEIFVDAIIQQENKKLGSLKSFIDEFLK